MAKLKSVWIALERMDRIVLVVAILVGTMLGALSVFRYVGYNAGMYDLGVMSQAISSGTRGQLLEYTYRNGNLSRLAWHVEVFYLILVPLYALFPSPATLVIVQALLFVVGVFPLYTLALRKIQVRWAARTIALSYLFYPVAHTAVLFDLHGDTLAIPWLLFAIEAMDRRAWRMYMLWILLALSCKFYVAVPVASIGGWLFLWGKEKQRGVFTFLLAGLWGSFTFLVLRPWLTPSEAVVAQSSTLGYLRFYFGQFWEGLAQTWSVRLLTAVVVFLPALWLGAHAWDWSLLALAVTLPVLVSSGPGPSYDYRYHHYALTVPLVMAAIVYGAARFREQALRIVFPEKRTRALLRWNIAVALTFFLTFAMNIMLVDTPLRRQFWLNQPGQGLHEWVYGRTPRDAFKDQWLSDYVPSEPPLISSSFLAPHVVNREVLYLFRYPDSELDILNPAHFFERLERVDYALADSLFDYVVMFGPDDFRGGLMYDMFAIKTLLQDSNFGLIAAQDGLLLFERDPIPVNILSQQVTVLTPTVLPAGREIFGEHIYLVDVELRFVDGDRWRFRFDWLIAQPLVGDTPFVAVTRLEGMPHTRWLHLPTTALYPVTEWEPGQIVREEFEVSLPDSLEPGGYNVLTGWYDTSNPFAYATDARSCVGEEMVVGEIIFGMVEKE